MERIKTFLSLMKETFDEWNRDKAPRLAAAMAYYTAFSIAPLLIVVIAIVGLIYGQEAVRGQLDNQIQGLVGAQAADAIQELVAGANHPQSGIIASIIGVVTLIFGAAGLFGQLQDALNTVWGVEPKPNLGIVATLRTRVLSFTMVLGIGFLLLVSLVISAALAALNTWMSGVLPTSPFVLQIINLVISLVVITALFAVIYKVLPDAKIAWRDVLLGAVVTAVLFTIGKFLIGLYLGQSSIASSYGAAGSFVVLLLWINYSAQILLFGAEFTQVYARRYGSNVVPADNARFVSAADLAQQGQSHGNPKAGTPAAAGGHAYTPANRQVAAQQTRIMPPTSAKPSSLPTVIVGIMAALASFLVGLLINNEQKH